MYFFSYILSCHIRILKKNYQSSTVRTTQSPKCTHKTSITIFINKKKHESKKIYFVFTHYKVSRENGYWKLLNKHTQKVGYKLHSPLQVGQLIMYYTPKRYYHFGGVKIIHLPKIIHICVCFNLSNLKYLCKICLINDSFPVFEGLVS